MAFSSTNFFTTLGKFIKHSNIWNGYFTALDTAKSDVSTVLNTYSLLDYFVPVPGQIEAFQAQVAGWIQQYANNVKAIVLDETTVISQLPIASGDMETVLSAIYDYMAANTVTIQTSVVTLGGTDADIKNFKIPIVVSAPDSSEARVFVSRRLDGLNPPSSNYIARKQYQNVESQMAMSCTIYAKCISSVPGQEVVQLFSELDANPSYDDEAEKPGPGPSLTNIESNNLVPSNFDFSNWSGDNPVDWTVTPGVSGTNWEDASGTGKGPLKIFTAGAYAKQKIGNLTRRQQYFFGVVFNSGGSTGTAGVKLRLENSDGSTVHATFTGVTVADVDVPAEFNIIYGFYSPTDGVNLDDIYLVMEHDAESDSGTYTDFYRAAISPVRFYNGLGWVFWNPITTTADTTHDLAVAAGTFLGTDPPEIPLDAYGSIAIVNNGAGVIQSYCRKVLGIQFPTADSPSLADSLAT